MDKNENVLSVNERKGLESDKKELEGALKDMESGDYGVGTQGQSANKETLKNQIKHLDKAIHAGTPHISRGGDKDAAAKEAKFLEGKIKEGMPTYDEMHNPENHPGAVMKNFHWQKKNAPVIKRWKAIQRTLEPNDPTISSVERFRTKKRTRWV